MAAAEVLGTAAIDILLRQKSLGSKQLQSDIRNTVSTLNKVETAATKNQTKWQRLSTSVEEFGRTMNKTSIILGIGGIVLKKFGESVIQASMGPLKAAASLQEELINVSKTTPLLGKDLDKLGKRFRKLSTVMPVSAEELSKIAAALGQLGIVSQMSGKQAVDALTTMSTTVSMLAVATDLSAEAAVLAIGKLGKSMGMTSETISNNAQRMGDVLNELSNTTAATAAQITKAMLNSASAASLLGVEFQDLAGINAILIQMGFEASRAGTLLKTALVRMAAESEKFQEIFGVMITDKTFSSTKDLEKAFSQLAKSMNEMSKTDATKNLKDIVGLRAFQAIQKLAESTQIGTGRFNEMNQEITEFQRVMAEANDEWQNGGSLAEEYSKVIGGFNKKLELLSGTWQAIQAGVGKGMLTIFGALITVLQKVLALVNLIPTPILSAFGALIGSLGLLVGGFALVLGSISAFTSVITFSASNLTALKDTVIKAGMAFGQFKRQIMEFEALKLFRGRILLELSGGLRNVNAMLGSSKQHFQALSTNANFAGKAIGELKKGSLLMSSAMGVSGKSTQLLVKSADDAAVKLSNIKKLIASKKMQKDFSAVFDLAGVSAEKFGSQAGNIGGLLKKLRGNLDAGSISSKEYDRQIAKIVIQTEKWRLTHSKLDTLLRSSNEQLLAQEGLGNLTKQNMRYNAVNKKTGAITAQQANSMGILGLTANNLKDKYNKVGGASGALNSGFSKLTKKLSLTSSFTGLLSKAWGGLTKVFGFVIKAGSKLLKFFQATGGTLLKIFGIIGTLILAFKIFKNIILGIKEIAEDYEINPEFKKQIAKIGVAFSKVADVVKILGEAFVRGGKALGKLFALPTVGILKTLGIIKKVDKSQDKLNEKVKEQTEEYEKQNEELTKSGSELDKLASKFQKLILPNGGQFSLRGDIQRTTGGAISQQASNNLASPETTAVTREALTTPTGSVVYNQNSVSMSVSVTDGDARRVAEIFADALNSPTSASVLQSIAPGGTSMITRL